MSTMALGPRRMLYEFLNARTVSVREAVPAWFRNASVPYTWIARERWAERKTSDTLFVVGSGPSVNDLSEVQWRHIGEHDSFGLNFAFLTRRPMTYFISVMNRVPSRLFSKRFLGKLARHIATHCGFCQLRCCRAWCIHAQFRSFSAGTKTCAVRFTAEA